MKNIRLKKVITVLSIVLLFTLFAGIATYKTMNARTFQFFGGIVNRVDTQDKAIAITFDDGPSTSVDTILSILDSEGVKATFFLVGSEIEKYPKETKKIISAGHQIGNHTFSHKYLVLKSPSYIKEEIERTDSLIREMGYKDTIQFRPPFGKKLIYLPYYLKQHNKKTITWDIEPNTYPDINSSSDRIVKFVVEKAKPGSIILLHPMYDKNGTTTGALKGIIEGLRDKGYKFKTVNELLENSAA